METCSMLTEAQVCMKCRGKKLAQRVLGCSEWEGGGSVAMTWFSSDSPCEIHLMVCIGGTTDATAKIMGSTCGLPQS
eukprot:scaffold213572_cov19-Tisochrysis_lutea.AAC.1